MIDTETPEAADPIDEAIAATEPVKVDSLVNEAVLPDGRKIRLVVPIEFGPDDFETCVSMLMQLRVVSEQRKAQRDDGLIIPEAPKLVGLDGRKL